MLEKEKNMSEEKLQMSFEPTVIEHLGVKMYSHTVPAIAELIANAYDACATEVEVRLFDKPKHKIVIKDNGIGMSFDEINDFGFRAVQAYFDFKILSRKIKQAGKMLYIII